VTGTGTGHGTGSGDGTGDDDATPVKSRTAPAPADPGAAEPAPASTAPTVATPVAHAARLAPVATGPAAPAAAVPSAPLVLAPAVTPLGLARGAGGLPHVAAGTAARALFAAGRVRPAPFDLRLDPVVAVRVRTAVATADGRPAGTHRPAPGSARHGGGSAPPAPPSPIGPPGNAGAGGVAGAAGGAASAVWCALLVGTLVLLLPELRRHRFRLVVPAPRGVAFSLQRPG